MSHPASPELNQSPWTQSVDPALQVIKIRIIQSSWYQQLFQSGRKPWVDPYPFIWGEYKKMTQWSEKLPPTLSPAIRTFFELELLYSYVYLLSPNPRCPEINEHAQKLIFDHCATYSSKMLHLTIDSNTKKPPFTFYDAIRVYMTARHFITTVSANPDGLLLQRRPTPASHYSTNLDVELDPLASSPGNNAPPLPQSELEGSLTESNSPIRRAINTINDFTSILSYFSQRFGYVGGISWRDRFQRESQPLLAQLQHRATQEKQLEDSLSLWNMNQLSPQQASLGQPSPSNKSAFYPSPPNSHYSPEHLPGTAMTMAWPPMPGSSELADLPVGIQQGLSSDLPVEHLEDLGLSQLTSWQTLPGGSMNARFG